jgi:hypothetical protein
MVPANQIMGGGTYPAGSGTSLESQGKTKAGSNSSSGGSRGPKEYTLPDGTKTTNEAQYTNAVAMAAKSKTPSLEQPAPSQPSKSLESFLPPAPGTSKSLDTGFSKGESIGPRVEKPIQSKPQAPAEKGWEVIPGTTTKYEVISPTGEIYPTNDPNYRPPSKGFVRVITPLDEQSPTQLTTTLEQLDKGGIGAYQYVKKSELDPQVQDYLKDKPVSTIISTEAASFKSPTQEQPFLLTLGRTDTSYAIPENLKIKTFTDKEGRIVGIEDPVAQMSIGLSGSASFNATELGTFEQRRMSAGVWMAEHPLPEQPQVNLSPDTISKPLGDYKASTKEEIQAMKFSQNVPIQFAKGISEGGIYAPLLGVQPQMDINMFKSDYLTPAEKAYLGGYVLAVPVDLITTATLPFVYAKAYKAASTAYRATEVGKLSVAFGTLVESKLPIKLGYAITSTAHAVPAAVTTYYASKKFLEVRLWQKPIEDKYQDIYRAGLEAQAPQFDTSGVVPFIKSVGTVAVQGVFPIFRDTEKFKQGTQTAMESKGMGTREMIDLQKRLVVARGIRQSSEISAQIGIGASSEALGQKLQSKYMGMLPGNVIESKIPQEGVKTILREVPGVSGIGEGATGVYIGQIAREDPRKNYITDRGTIQVGETTIPGLTKAEEIAVGGIMGYFSAKLIGGQSSIAKYESKLYRESGKPLKGVAKGAQGYAWEYAGYGLDLTEKPGDIVEGVYSGLPGFGRAKVPTFVWTPSSTTTEGGYRTVSVKATTISETQGFSQPTPANVPSNVFSNVPANVFTNVPANVPSNIPTTTMSNVPTNIFTNVPANVPSNVPSNIPANVPANIPANIPTNIFMNVPVNVPIDVPANVPANVPIDVNVNVPTFPWLPGLELDLGGKGRGSRAKTTRQYQYVPDLIAMVLGQTTGKKPGKGKLYGGEERRLIYNPVTGKRKKKSSRTGRPKKQTNWLNIRRAI